MNSDDNSQKTKYVYKTLSQKERFPLCGSMRVSRSLWGLPRLNAAFPGIYLSSMLDISFFVDSRYCCVFFCWV